MLEGNILPTVFFWVMFFAALVPTLFIIFERARNRDNEIGARLGVRINEMLFDQKTKRYVTYTYEQGHKTSTRKDRIESILAKQALDAAENKASRIDVARQRALVKQQ